MGFILSAIVGVPTDDSKTQINLCYKVLTNLKAVVYLILIPNKFWKSKKPFL